MPVAPAETLATLEENERVRITVHEETVEGIADWTVVEDDRILVFVSERGTDRVFMVQSLWANGWLEPQADVADVTEDDPTFEPLGAVEEVRTPRTTK